MSDSTWIQLRRDILPITDADVLAVLKPPQRRLNQRLGVLLFEHVGVDATLFLEGRRDPRREVAALHVSQLVLDVDDPRIHFDDERKNGPGTVALIYGAGALVDRVDALGARDREWTGYLFPSKKSKSGHIRGETVQSRFQRVCERAEVYVDGDTPTSKMGRRFWYTTYLESQADLLENLDAIAADQGSSDPSVVLRNYLPEEERRKYRRQFMRDRLAEAFER